jgi:hypothetical protein
MTTFATGGDNRIKFGQTINVSGTGSISLDVTGGPMAALQVAIFDAADKLLSGVGFGALGQVLTTQQGGHVSWVFLVPKTTSYIKWGVQAFRSAANLGSYQAQVVVRDASGNALATGSFSATIPDGAFQDDIVYDGVNLAPQPQAVPAGASVVGSAAGVSGGAQ